MGKSLAQGGAEVRALVSMARRRGELDGRSSTARTLGTARRAEQRSKTCQGEPAAATTGRGARSKEDGSGATQRRLRARTQSSSSGKTKKNVGNGERQGEATIWKI